MVNGPKSPVVYFWQFGTQQRVFNSAPGFYKLTHMTWFIQHTLKIKGTESHTGLRHVCTCCCHGSFLAQNNILVELGN